MAQVKVLSSGMNYTSVPEKYVRPASERPDLSQVSDSQTIPLIDLSHPDKSFIIHQIRDACHKFGFFQVVNHGVRKEAMDGMIRMSSEFFNLPVEEKMKLYSDDPNKSVRVGTSFNVNKEEVFNWRDFLRLHCWPLSQHVPQWPSTPTSFKETVSTYCMEVRSLAMRLEEAISESLGLEKHYLTQALGEQAQYMAINYYPPCPEPDLVFGLPAHTDPHVITILLQDSEVSGLQLLVDGTWISIKPHPDAFVVNIGDMLKVLSNGLYKSGWHRVMVNANKPRISVASFISPPDDALISSPSSLTTGESGSMYRDFTYKEYFNKIWSGNLLEQEHCLEHFKK